MKAFSSACLSKNALSQSKPSMALESRQHLHVHKDKYVFHMGEDKKSLK